MSDASDGPVVTKRSIWYRLYHGETDLNIVGRWRVWFAISMIAVLIGLVSLFTRGLNLGIDFEGGVVWEVGAGDASLDDARDAVAETGLRDATVLTVDSEQSGRTFRIESRPIDPEQTDEVSAALAEVTGQSTDDVNLNSVGPSWGREISDKAVRALVVFLVLVTLYITLRFQLKMAIPTLVALIHDVLFTVGVYSLTQFEVTPATVIAILTILGFSIYDGIVVFDKVDENTRLVSSTGGTTYSDMINLSLNQTLMRTLNTSITALLPVGSLLVVGSWMMGASTLEEFALALLVGLFSGAYSSIFIASPLLALLKEREPRNRDIRRRIEARAAAAPAAQPGRKAAAGAATRPKTTRSTARSGAAAESGAATEPVGDEDESEVPVPSGGNGGKTSAPRPERVIPPRPRKKSKGRRR
jgi:preprotein translocase subunit SecF